MNRPHLSPVLLATAVAWVAAGAQSPYGEPGDPELTAVMSHIRGRTMDKIPAIDQPNFVDSLAAASFLTGADLVVGIARNGVAKAYPVKFLNGHEIVNDSLGTAPIVVTWCPIVARSIVYDPNINSRAAVSRVGRLDTALAFGVSGILRNSALVMYDRATISLWTLDGVAIAGPLQGMRLRSYPSERTRWRTWLDRHPDTLVMGPPTRKARPPLY